MLTPPRRSTSRGFQSLDLLISGFLQDVGFQIPDLHAPRIRGSWGMGCTKHCNAQKNPKFLIPNLTKPCNAQKIPKIPKFWHLCPGQDHVPENFGIF